MNPNPALKLDLMICHFAYGGNGGVSMESPDLREWEVQAVLKMKQDPRIGKIHLKTISDTPICMTRNAAVRKAREAGCHVLMMVDSDQSPNKHKGEPWFRDFFEVAFDEIYNHYGKGPLVVGAPYCGPPTGIENVYVFQFQSTGTGRGDETRFSLEQYTRAQAAKMSGVQECAALPTGFILFDMRCFDLIEPSGLSTRSILEQVSCGKMTLEDAEMSLMDGYFHYEWPDQYADRKDSTEDVVCTRNIALAGMSKLGYNPVRCAWDSWVGHHKPWNVGKPEYYGVEHIAASFRKTCVNDDRIGERIVDLDNLPLNLPKSILNKTPIVARSRAPLVSWEHAHQTSVRDRSALTQLVKEVLAEKPECRVLEVGSWLGGTAITMADAGADVTCIDTWEGSPNDATGVLAKLAKMESKDDPDVVLNEFKRQVGNRLHRTIHPRQATSLEAAEWGWPYKFDIIFLDADHAREALAADIEAWLPHLAPDGIMCGHDYGIDDFPGVKQAVDERFGSRVERAGEWVWVVRPALELV